ncbi:MAG: DNA mismatch repair endonuclease MutL [Acidobacteriota bacterium]
MSKIQILDDHLVSQIAAGEVVERPSSVVKELVENALDAGAQDVKVVLESGGKRRIVVHDDGSGMDRDDALLAFDRHATSKIARFEDLERVGTLGFRGEALATIAAVGRVTLRTATTAGDGQQVRIEGGRVKSVEPVAHPKGTRIEVASLFFNVPARRKFLKTPRTELRHAVEVVQGYALAHPAVRFTLEHDGRSLLEAPPVSDDNDGYRRRIGQIFGHALTEHLVPLRPPGLPKGERILGFLGDPDTGRSRRTFLWVNRRLLRDRALLSGFYRAVREVWKTDAFPALFLYLEIPPEEVDVNVHPQKAEVRFRDRHVLDRVESTIRATLEHGRRGGIAPLRPPRARVQPRAWEGLGATGGEWKVVRGGTGRIEPGPHQVEPRQTPASRQTEERQPVEAWRPVETQRPEPRRPETPQPGVVAESAGLYDAQWTDSQSQAARPARVDDSSHAPAVETPRAEDTRIAQPLAPPAEPRSVAFSGKARAPGGLRILGQYKGSLILLEGDDGLYLVDQHAAHERLLYERLRLSFLDQSPASQTLLDPPVLELAPAEALRARELAGALERCGFGVRPMSGHTVAVTAIPTMLDAEDAVSTLGRLLGDSRHDGEDDLEAVRRSLLDALAAERACKAAIKIHRPLRMEEMERLVSELFDAEDPWACPHGRPTILVMGDAELERRFGRR